MKKKLTDNDYFYYSFLATIILFLIVVLIYNNYLYKYFVIPGCIFYLNFGFYCPACGMTRAFLSLLSGDILKSIYYNPTVIYILGYISIFMITNTICKIFKKETIIKYSNFYLYLGIFIMMINFIIRNILLLRIWNFNLKTKRVMVNK